MREYQRIGFLTAIDDFGAGFAGLNLLADFQPDIIKLDMGLIRDINRHAARQSIVRSITRICEELKIGIIAEGVETIEECRYLQDIGINLMQGYLFSKPLFQQCGSSEALNWPID
jgi:EAL domain-containing protein (putative c-di-GMP-specific phosphodiesterase class I)